MKIDLKIAAFIIFVSCCILFKFQSVAQQIGTSQCTEMVLRSEVKWEPLNPNRLTKCINCLSAKFYDLIYG